MKAFLAIFALVGASSVHAQEPQVKKGLRTRFIAKSVGSPTLEDAGNEPVGTHKVVSEGFFPSDDEDEEMDYAEDEEETEVGVGCGFSKPQHCPKGQKPILCGNPGGPWKIMWKCGESTDFDYEADSKGTKFVQKILVEEESSTLSSSDIDYSEDEEMNYAEDEEETEVGVGCGMSKPQRCPKGQKPIQCGTSGPWKFWRCGESTDFD